VRSALLFSAQATGGELAGSPPASRHTSSRQPRHRDRIEVWRGRLLQVPTTGFRVSVSHLMAAARSSPKPKRYKCGFGVLVFFGRCVSRCHISGKNQLE
jgi:hypothetical protein